MVNRSQEFADRMTEFERDRDVDSFVSDIFAADVELVRPETGRQLSGHDGARTFWQEYVHRFQQVESTFSRVRDGELGVLEWTSSAQLPNGTDIVYAGVSLLDFDAEGQVQRFSTYYDTGVFQRQE